MDLTRITVFCFTASYAVALSIEAGSLVRRFGWHRLVLLAFAGAGVFAHVAYLVARAGAEAAPLSSPADWCLLASLVLAAVYLASTLLSPKLATGLFLLPMVLVLIAFSYFASNEPIAVERASRFWGQTHSWLLILATVTVSLGFLAGLMYLIQSWRLKQKLPPAKSFRLPSLETLERVNGRALGLSAWLVAGGFVSGVVLTRLRQSEPSGHGLWTDPLVISLAVMFLWLVIAEAFRLVYPSARRGQKVAYLTLASFLFLVITLASMALVNRAKSEAKLQQPGGVWAGSAGQGLGAFELGLAAIEPPIISPAPLAPATPPAPGRPA